MTQDFPAAHSMDTEWYAVDADGCVALFSSGEGGAVARNALKSWEGDHRLLKRASKLREAAPVRYELEDFKRFTRMYSTRQYELTVEPDGTFHTDKPPSHDDVLLLFCADPNELENEVRRFRGTVNTAGSTPVVEFPRISKRALERIHRRGACLACRHIWRAGSRTPEQYGLFVFEPAYDQFPGPYLREASPTQPLKLSEFPWILRSKIAGAQLKGVRFSETPMFNPIGMVPCDTWYDGSEFERDREEGLLSGPPFVNGLPHGRYKVIDWNTNKTTRTILFEMGQETTTREEDT